MATFNLRPTPRLRLPVKPSLEHLRKQAKRLAKSAAVTLSAAQRRLAGDYGFRNWPELVAAVDVMNRTAEVLVDVPKQPSALAAAARARDLERVRAILVSEQFTQHDLNLALAHAACYGGEAPEVLAVRKAIFDLLLAHGADPDGQYGSAYGPIVFGTGECLSPAGLQWLLDAGADVQFAPVETKYGVQCALGSWLSTYARGENDKKHRGIELLLQAGAKVPAGVTPEMLAIHRGDRAGLEALVAREPGMVQRHYADMPYGNLSLKGGTLLHCAVEFGEWACAELLLARGAAVDGTTAAGNTALFHVCRSECPDGERLVMVERLLAAGANPRRQCAEKATPLHAAAARGPLALVELLLRHDAKEWMTDEQGRKPLAWARAGNAAEKEAIAEVLDRPVIRDAGFKRAVQLLHAGDAAGLREHLREQPQLMAQRAMEPACYPVTYFSNPKLMWFIANNPKLIETMQPNVVALAEVLLEAGPAAEDVAYAIELVMTSASAKAAGQQVALIRLLMGHGGRITNSSVLTTLAYQDTALIRTLIEGGMLAANHLTMAALGDAAVLARLVPTLGPADLHAAFSVAVINRQAGTAEVCLKAGVGVNGPLAVHGHSCPLHQAALNDDVAMVALLCAFGGDLGRRDTMWGGRPVDWARHGGAGAARAYLEAKGG